MQEIAHSGVVRFAATMLCLPRSKSGTHSSRHFHSRVTIKIAADVTLCVESCLGLSMALLSTFKLLDQPSLGTLAGIGLQNDGSFQPRHWYAVFTSPNHEKRVSWQCERKRVETFLPLYAAKRKWKNRRTVELQVPLFPCYSFVRITTCERLRVLEIPGVISIVSAAGQPLPVPNEYIQALREGLLAGKVEPHPNIEVGDTVRIKNGPFAGAQG